MMKELQDKYAGVDCFIDDQPAKICGRLLDFAVVVSDDCRLHAEFSWPTVDRVMKAGGRFRF